MSIPLKLPYKGSRHYLHGTDVFNAVQKTISNLPNSKGAYIGELAFKRFAYHACDLHMGTCESIDDAIGKGEINLPGGERRAFYICEGSQKPRFRVPFDEEPIMNSAEFHGQAATLKAPFPFTTIEIIIALTKALNYHLAEPKNGKWIFGKINLDQALPTIKNHVTITCEKAIQGRFSVSAIVVDDTRVGTIQFIVGTP